MASPEFPLAQVNPELLAYFAPESVAQYGPEYSLGSMCHVSTIPAEYERLFDAGISEDAVRASINLLAKYRTVRLYSNGEVEIKESVNLSRQ